jgi:preprotein translocase subunit Sec61beta
MKYNNMLNKKAQTRMPSSFGGLVQYYSDYKSKITIKPRTVIIMGIILVIVVVGIKAVFS